VKAEYINPFVESVYDLFNTMFSCKVQRGNIALASSEKNPSEIAALIGLSGEGKGIVTLTFPETTALTLASTMLCTEIKTMDKTVSDTVAEIVNIVAGGAKAKFSISQESTDKTPLELSLPTVVRGAGFSISYPSDSIWLEIPFTSDLGPFKMRVTFEMKKDKVKNT
jgi:chemotaxis protein CheX